MTTEIKYAIKNAQGIKVRISFNFFTANNFFL
jgi:hypothetical protein